MGTLLWLVIALPLAGYLILAFLGRRLPRSGVALVGVGSIALSALVTVLLALDLMGGGEAHAQSLWTWFEGGGLSVDIGLRMDALAAVMTLVVTIVGALIHAYSAEFMEEDPGYSRFFAYMNLFVASMLTLVLADNLVLLYLGWEGVGLCSYLLIGFWYQDPANGRAAQKAFIVTRIGDVAMALGLFLIFRELGTLEITEVLSGAREAWPRGSANANWAAALLLGGALGKSAQIPLHTWLPDAMAGPTPTSALIHAATMVTAGVYLIARTHPLFVLAPDVLFAVAIIGALTMLLAGFTALAQNDIKRVLAYSTISQIGLMFLALGVGAWTAAIFHLMTHAFFKALLFLAAGSVIHSAHHEHDIRRMGGLKRELPKTYRAFIAGGASLAALPLVTAGFYSKELILWQTWVAHRAGFWLWTAGVVSAFVTAFYIFRLVFLVFHGESHAHVDRLPGARMHVPLAVLSVLAIVGGLVELPGTLGGVHLFSGFLEPVLPQPPGAHGGLWEELALQLFASLVAIAGVVLAWAFFGRRPRVTERDYESPLVHGAVARTFHGGFGFDAVNDRTLVEPYNGLAHLLRHDPVDAPVRGIARVFTQVHAGLARTQSGQLRWYAGAIALGTALVLLVGVLT